MEGTSNELSPGSPVPASAEPDHRVISGFWRRLAAFAIDCLLLGLLGAALGWLAFDPLAQLGGWGRALGFCVALVYFGLANSAIGRGQTPGKRIMKIEVVDCAGRHISLGRSFLRYALLGIPFFLNGAMIPVGVILSPAGWLLVFLVFGLGGATGYLLVFNRRTRQGLHDLVVGTFVTRTDPSGDVVGSVWRGHVVMVGLWCAAVIVLSVTMTGLAKKGTLAGLVEAQRAVQSSGKVHVAPVNVGTSLRIADGSRSEATFVSCNAFWRERLVDYEPASREVAQIILESYSGIMDKDSLVVTITYGYDIGIARGGNSQTYQHSPAEWRAMMAGAPVD